jgi:outer membrane receptor protein involved in Fe transport
MGGLATLIDVEQFEVLRGPQGTTYGANALAGLIKVKTRDPRPQYEFAGEASTAQYGTGSIGAVIGGPLNLAGPDSAFRLVAQRYRSDGFRRNVFTGRDDSNGLDESTLRGKLRVDSGGDWRVDVSGFYVDQDNGYDAWSIDNSFVTRSDYPGRDVQRSRAAEARVSYSGWSAATLESITTYANTQVVYSFDDDWGNNPFWLASTGYSPYNYYSDIRRQRTTRSQELRLASKNETPRAGRLGWVAGVYALDLREANSDVEFAQDVSYDPIGSASDLISRYAATNSAVYGQADYDLSAATTLSAGLRFERRVARYADSDGVAFAPGENMLGGNVSVVHRWRQGHSLHSVLARGYKAGGVNIGLEVPGDRRRFDAEYLWNLEVGDRAAWLSNRLTTDIALFYMRRASQQVSSSMQDPGNPSKFIFIVGNAARGENYGLEASATYQLAEPWSLSGSLSALRTRFIDYRYVDTFTGELHNLDGRAQAHAPGYQFSLSADWHHPSGWMARVDVTGKGSFYFETSSNQASSAYQLLNARFGYERQQWSAYLWASNLLNRSYAVRGFFFGNEPPEFINKLYLQHGDPRQVGLTVRYQLSQP